MTGAPWELPALARTPGAHNCPACAAVMTSEPLEGLALERCGEHGVWFAAHELQTVLERAGRAK